MKIVTTEEIRGLEAACVGHGISTDDLMEQAGLAVAQEARNILDSAAGKRILVLVGPGNNGGDVLVAARHLARWGASVTAYLPLERHSPDPNLDLALLEEVNAQNTASDPDYRLLDRELQASHLVIDALLGTGRARPLEGPLGEVVHRLQYRKGLLLALDLPTGVDADTGHVEVKRYVAADDCGPRINPMIVDGQIHGGVVQGIGPVLWEGAIYDEDGQLLTGSMMDYAIPKSNSLPEIETLTTVTESPHHPLGIKGVGETGTIASTITVYNAVMDALKPFGVDKIDMPLTPERVWQAIHENGKGS